MVKKGQKATNTKKYTTLHAYDYNQKKMSIILLES